MNNPIIITNKLFFIPLIANGVGVYSSLTTILNWANLTWEANNEWLSICNSRKT